MKIKKLNVKQVECMGSYVPQNKTKNSPESEVDEWDVGGDEENDDELPKLWLNALLKWIDYSDNLKTGKDSDSNSNSTESNVEPNESSTEEIPEDDELSDIESWLDEAESSDVPDMVDLDE